MWIYKQSTGELFRKGEAKPVGCGYAGCSVGKNKPESQHVPNMGPIPQGLWDIGEPYDTAKHGPFVMRLTPRPETNTFGRSGFLMHGDSKSAPGTASEGCIVLAPWIRTMVHDSGDKLLEVIA